jgi:hypothetical protein
LHHRTLSIVNYSLFAGFFNKYTPSRKANRL